jgi:hypothetical protein
MPIRVVAPGKPAFPLRKGEEGISVFEEQTVAPPLTEEEILACFRTGSQLVSRTREEIEAKGLVIVPIRGADPLPERLRTAHAEIRPGPE